jgi:hypothetical protein
MPDDLNDPRISAYKPQRRILVPKPPGPRQKPSAAKRKLERKQEARTQARIARTHLVGLTDAGTIIMAALVVVVVVVLVVVLVSHH